MAQNMVAEAGHGWNVVDMSDEELADQLQAVHAADGRSAFIGGVLIGCFIGFVFGYVVCGVVL